MSAEALEQDLLRIERDCLRVQLQIRPFHGAPFQYAVEPGETLFAVKQAFLPHRAECVPPPLIVNDGEWDEENDHFVYQGRVLGETANQL